MVETSDDIYRCKQMIKDDIISARFNLAELPPSRETSLVRL